MVFVHLVHTTGRSRYLHFAGEKSESHLVWAICPAREIQGSAQVCLLWRLFLFSLWVYNLVSLWEGKWPLWQVYSLQHESWKLDIKRGAGLNTETLTVGLNTENKITVCDHLCLKKNFATQLECITLWQLGGITNIGKIYPEKYIQKNFLI